MSDSFWRDFARSFGVNLDGPNEGSVDRQAIADEVARRRAVHFDDMRKDLPSIGGFEFMGYRIADMTRTELLTTAAFLMVRYAKVNYPGESTANLRLP